MEPNMAFVVRAGTPPAVDVRVNFGVYAGREATTAEIERLAEWLLDEIGEVSIVSEERHEFDANVAASIHQVRIEVAPEAAPRDLAERLLLEQRILERAEHWARLCVSERHAEISDGV
jgi:hypothetical protein